MSVTNNHLIPRHPDHHAAVEHDATPRFRRRRRATLNEGGQIVGRIAGCGYAVVASRQSENEAQTAPRHSTSLHPRRPLQLSGLSQLRRRMQSPFLFLLPSVPLLRLSWFWAYAARCRAKFTAERQSRRPPLPRCPFRLRASERRRAGRPPTLLSWLSHPR